MRFVMTCLAGLVAACSAGPQTGDTGGGQTREGGQTYKVYYLGGQSNMDGYGHVSELSEDQTGPVANAYIYTGNGAWDGEAGGSIGYWGPLTPGHGTGFATDGETNALSDRFGPELSFGRALAANSDQPIALIKYSRGGTSLADGAGYSDWFPEAGGADDLNQYDFALATIRNALAARDIDGDGRLDQLEPAGIIWMQGESDAFASHETAAAYQDNLRRMMDLFRAALHRDDLPVVIGRISDSGMNEDGQMMPYIDTVLAAQAAYVDSDSCAAYVTEIETYSHSDDAWHYDTAAYLQMGQAFAEAVTQLETACGQTRP
ncbi:sialate O-acetylesterase [uncultured Maricaulis sp.]|uniref:sialate O-acetylesterase n=1 Tax=uncultured Maricaulis sp. TaxID=174710 RepID=UPI0025FE3B62|nr:sialate O-acetylesterase [uncultured Maricaulis sp.]